MGTCSQFCFGTWLLDGDVLAQLLGHILTGLLGLLSSNGLTILLWHILTGLLGLLGCTFLYIMSLIVFSCNDIAP